jgi:glycosyltransferase involved in cell wall biosynthesis
MSENKYNIIYLCADSGIPYGGVKGGAIHMREIVSCFARNNCEVTVVARDAGSDAPEVPGVTAYDLPQIKDREIVQVFSDLLADEGITGEFEDFHRNPDLESLLDRIYSEKNIDVVYERYSLFNVAGLRFCKKNRIPFILEVNAPLIGEAQKYRRLFFPDTAAAVEKKLFENADHIIAVSGELKKYITDKTPGASVTVVPNGVRFDHFASGESGDQGNGGGEFIVGFLGSLKPWHGVEILIDSFARLAGDGDDCRLLIIGDNKKQDRYLEKRCRKRGIENRVTFTGAVDYVDIPEWLRKADVLVAPYPMIDDFYFSSLKVFEYMAAGKAIVASGIGQISSILTHGKTALLVRPGDLDSLTEALRKLKDDAGLRARLGERAQVEARLKHTWNHRVIDILKIIRKLAGGKRRS